MSVDAGPALLRALYVEGPEENTRFTIELSRLTGHSVEHDLDRGDLQIVLSDTVVRDPPSPINLRGSAIRAVKSDLVDRDLRVRLDVPNAMWTQVAMVSDPKPPRLVIDLAALSRKAAAAPPAKPAFPTERKRSFTRKRPSATDPKTVGEAYKRGVSLAEKGKVEDAVEQLWIALSLDGAHIEAREALASLLLQTGRNEEAAHILDEGLTLQPNHPRFAKLRARILLERGETEQALSLLEEAAPRIADDPEYHALIAAVLLRRGEQAQAVQRYWRVLEIEPDRGAWWLGLAIALEAESSPAQALMAYRTAATVGGLSPDSRQYVEARIGALQPREP
jgi:MSHA biogenesis protein MshN